MTTIENSEQCRSCKIDVCEVCDYCGCDCDCLSCDDCDSTFLKKKECSNCNNCPDCCQCFTCTYCSRKSDEGCSTCNECINCCDCVICEVCQETVESSSCEEHAICKNCQCPCRNTFDYKNQTIDNGSKNFETFKLQRTVGVEWEYAESDSFDPIFSWAKKWNAGHQEDGSCGWECVTPPMNGDTIEKVLHELCDSFDSASAIINDKCGIHVHVDAKDYCWHDMYRLMKVYSKVEPLLYLLGGQRRVHNKDGETHYAKPVGQKFINALNSSDVKNSILSIVYARTDAGKIITDLLLKRKLVEGTMV